MAYDDSGFQHKHSGNVLARFCQLPNGLVECALEVAGPRIYGDPTLSCSTVYFGIGLDTETAKADAELRRKVKEAE